MAATRGEKREERSGEEAESGGGEVARESSGGDRVCVAERMCVQRRRVEQQRAIARRICVNATPGGEQRKRGGNTITR